MPTMLQQAKNLVKAGERAITALVTPGQRVLAPADVVKRRQEICKGCQEKRPQVPVLKKTDRCRECGCILSVKTEAATEQCPLGKWAAVSSKEEFMEPGTAAHIVQAIPAIKSQFEPTHVLTRIVCSYLDQKRLEQEKRKSRKGTCGSCKKSNSPEELLLVHTSNALKTLTTEDLVKLIEILPKNVYFKFRGNMRTVAEILEEKSE